MKRNFAGQRERLANFGDLNKKLPEKTGVFRLSGKCKEALLAKRADFGYTGSEVSDMDSTRIGALLRALRRERGMTQSQMAAELQVSRQAVSRWERGQGCPDVSLLPALAELFGVSVERLLTGDLAPQPQEVGNLKRTQFYVCPDCGNLLTATGGGELHCCGRRLEPLVPRPADTDHAAEVQTAEEDWYITFRHPMEKDHSIRFAALVGLDRLLVGRLYPEQGGEVRIPQLRGGGKLYLCCSRDGLFEIPLPRRRPVRSGRLPEVPER